MSILNRRNAVVGWLTWAVGKRVLRRKAKGAVPAGGAAKGGAGALALVLGAIAGLVGFRRFRSGDRGAAE